jgi:hypothetical protein
MMKLGVGFRAYFKVKLVAYGCAPSRTILYAAYVKEF